MLGRQDPQPRLFEAVRISELVPANHMLRRLAKAVDYRFIRDLVAPFYCSNNGRPSCDPVLIFKMLVLGRVYDMSDRRLCDEVQMHAGFRWFCGLGFEDAVPDHSTLTVTRERWSSAEQAVWQGALDHVVSECVGAGLVSGRHVSVDGTEIRADAAITSLERIPEPLPGPAPRPDPAPAPDPGSPSGKPEELVSSSVVPTSADGEVAEPVRRAGDENFHGERFSNATHRSKTDPEALLFRKGKAKEAKLAYMGHALIDTKSRTVLAADASPAIGSAERTVGLDLLDHVRDNLELPNPVQAIAADKAYGTGTFLAAVCDREIEPHIPVPGSAALEKVPVYQRAPASARIALKRFEQRRHVEARNRARTLVKTPRGRLSHRLRTRVEHVHAEAKGRHGLRRARLRGLQKVRTEVKLTATVQNLKRLASRRPAKDRPALSVRVDSVLTTNALEAPPSVATTTWHRLQTPGRVIAAARLRLGLSPGLQSGGSSTDF